jgi:hypothetical protein
MNPPHTISYPQIMIQNMHVLSFENKAASKSHVKMRGTLSDPPAADASEFPMSMPGIRA